MHSTDTTALATAKVIDISEDMVFGMKFQGAGLIILSLISLLPKKVNSVPKNIGEVFNENYSAEKEIKFFCMCCSFKIFHNH